MVRHDPVDRLDCEPASLERLVAFEVAVTEIDPGATDSVSALDLVLPAMAAALSVIAIIASAHLTSAALALEEM